jgi:hypothetical protein
LQGHRIEKGEILNAIHKYPGVKDCDVNVVEDRSGPVVAATLEFADKTGPDIKALTSHLRDLLPAPSVPSVFITADDIVLADGGKTDWAASASRAQVRARARLSALL